MGCAFSFGPERFAEDGLRPRRGVRFEQEKDSQAGYFQNL